MKKLLFFLTILCASFSAIEAQTITWTGAGDGTNWSDGNNWDLPVLPSTSNDVIIPTGFIVTLDVASSIKSIDVQGTTTFNINATLTFSENSFTGINTTVNWSSSLLDGGGILTNRGTLNIIGYGYTRLWSSTLNNTGTVIVSKLLFIEWGGVFNNQESGIVNLAENGHFSSGWTGFGTLNNYGVLKKTGSEEVAYIDSETNNFGTIEAMSGILKLCSFLGLNNKIDGIIKGTASIELIEPANFTNDGTFAPGASPGTLTVIGDFTSSSTSKLAVEINGLNQGTEYDLLAIQGDAVFDGVVDVKMGYEGAINDEFVIATTTGTITQCSLAPTASSIFNSKIYDFSVQCRNNNEVVLTITNITDVQTLAWNGGGDGVNWSDANNWSPAIVPTLGDDVIIPDRSTLTIDVSAYAKSIEVLGTSTINMNNSLTFTDESSFGTNSVVNWSYGGLWSGDTGPDANITTLNNKGIINITGGTWISYCTLNNEGTINILSTGDLSLLTDGNLNNQVTGVIDMQGDGSAILPMIPVPGYFTIGKIINLGIIKGANDTGITDSVIAGIYVPVDNYGTIEILTGKLSFGIFELNNTIDGIIKGTATLEVSEFSNDFINDGTFAPGSSPGTLTFIGSFTSSSSSKLAVEINGLDQGVDYDLLTIQGNAVMDGIVDVTLGFEGNVNDEFIVATTTGTVTQCTLASTATSIFDGQQYDFDVKCRNNNEVVLTIVDKALGVDTNELADAKILLFPNPTNDIITLRNDSGLNLQTATIFDISGRVLKTVDLNGIGRDGAISLYNYESGHYFVKINSDDGSIVKRFIKL